MMSRTAGALAAPMAVVVAVMTIFGLVNGPFRQVETATAAHLLTLLGVAPGAVEVRPNSTLAVHPEGIGGFLAIVTPSCSALSSLLAVAFLACFTPHRGRRGRQAVAVGAALLCVAAGNVLRIAGSIGIGLAAGTGSLVLFHDWVGSLFAFAYTLGGYLLMLYLLLPAGPTGSTTAGAWTVSRVSA